jgi:hypothetical protein
MKTTITPFLSATAALLVLGAALSNAQPTSTEQRVNCSRNACLSIRDRIPSCILSIKNPGSGDTQLPANNVQGKGETAQRRPIYDEDGVWGCRSTIAFEYDDCLNINGLVAKPEQPASRDGASSSASKSTVVMQTKQPTMVERTK